ncbi:MAG: uroporphyrinogen-III synthase [Alcaligenaceae bacterium]|jgi:uroporphyrinogen-III synthase
MAHAHPTAILTRPAGRNTVIVQALSRQGWPILECPALEIQSVPVLPVFDTPRPEHFDLIVFVSRAAVTGYRRQLPENFTWPAGVTAACMGPVTASAITRTFGADLTVLHPEGVASQDSEALWPLILGQKLLPRRVLILRGQDGREWLGEKLTKLDVAVTIHQTYQREVASWPDQVREPLLALAGSGGKAVWLLTSTHGIEAIVSKVSALNIGAWFRNSAFVLTHERLKPILAKMLDADLDRLCCQVASPEDPAIVLCFDQMIEQLNRS